MQSSAKSSDLESQEQHLDGFVPLHTEKSTGFDASPNAERQDGLSRRPTRVLDPRSPLTRLTSSITERPNFSHLLAKQKTGSDVLVDFDSPDDPYRPLNWPNRKKFITVLLYGLTTMCSSWATSMYSSAINHSFMFGGLTIRRFSSDVSAVGKEYHVADIVSTLGLTLFLFG